MDKFIIEDLKLVYSDGAESLRGVSLNIPANSITVIFGPAGGGKSTLLRVLNRLNDLADVKHVSGKVLMRGANGDDTTCSIPGWMCRTAPAGGDGVRPSDRPAMSIRENLTYSLSLAGVRDQRRLD
jgi:phosphate transport system ATP-binding protein